MPEVDAVGPAPDPPQWCDIEEARANHASGMHRSGDDGGGHERNRNRAPWIEVRIELVDADERPDEGAEANDNDDVGPAKPRTQPAGVSDGGRQRFGRRGTTGRSTSCNAV